MNDAFTFFLTKLKDFNNNYAEAIQALTPFIIIFFSLLFSKEYRDQHRKRGDALTHEEGDAAVSVEPIFWSFGKKFKILAVHQYEKSGDVSGYRHLSQNSRPDQWEKLIKVESSFCNLKHEIIPIKKDEILTVVISRNGLEKWKNIEFNQ